jgi:hypothetical protein
MKEQWEEECAALRAEIAALHQQVQALVAQQAPAKTSARGPLFKSSRIVWLLPVFVVLSAAGVLYGQGGMEALFIDARGNVGVGTTTPQGFQVALPENSKPAAPNVGVTLAGGREGNASIELRGKEASTPLIDFAQSARDYDARIRLTATGQLAIEGASVGIGTEKTDARLDVTGKANDEKQISLQLRSGNTGAQFESNQITFGFNGTNTYRHAIKTRHDPKLPGGNAIDFILWGSRVGEGDPTAIGGRPGITVTGEGVGIGTILPHAKLDVQGDIRATRITLASQKACSAVTAGNWRDTFIVPASWTKDQCQSFSTWQGAPGYNLLCISENGYSAGSLNGGIPSPNCGW